MTRGEQGRVPPTLLKGNGTCGTPLHYEYKLLEAIPPVLGDTCRLIQRLTAPARRLYIRVNTLRVSVEEYLEVLRREGIVMRRDEEIPEALWAPVEGPLPFNIYDKRVVADKRASESVLMGSDLYAPGVLEARGVRPGDKVTIYSPNGIPVGSGVALMGERDLRPGRKHGLFVRLTEPMYRSVRVGDLPGRDEGLFYGQGLPSMYVARLLEPGSGERIIDLTAAPGGKVSHIAQLAGPKSRIVAVDRRSKTSLLRRTLTRLGAGWVEVIGHDARYLPVDYPSLEESFDKAVLDPPCSNLGVIPKVYDSKSMADSANLARYQVQLARSAYRLLRKGGVLAYSVCTLSEVETEAQARAFEELGFELVEPPSWARRPIRSGGGLFFSPLIHGVTGFYIALLRKV